VPISAIRLHAEASAEYDAAFDWYLERSPDAALRFDSEVQRAMDEIAGAPQRWAQASFGTRRRSVWPWPTQARFWLEWVVPPQVVAGPVDHNFPS